MNQIENLTETIDAFNKEANRIANDVKILQDKSRRDRHLLYTLGSLFIVSILTISMLTYVGNNIRYTSDTIKDCISPSGTCYKRSAEKTTKAIIAISYHSEIERITTELPIAEQKGDTLRVKILTDRVKELRNREAEALR